MIFNENLYIVIYRQQMHFFKYPGQIRHATMVSQLFSYGGITSILHDLTNEGNVGREKKKKISILFGPLMELHRHILSNYLSSVQLYNFAT